MASAVVIEAKYIKGFTKKQVDTERLKFELRITEQRIRELISELDTARRMANVYRWRLEEATQPRHGVIKDKTNKTWQQIQ
jgi:hypothetical protein